MTVVLQILVTNLGMHPGTYHPARSVPRARMDPLASPDAYPYPHQERVRNGN